MVNPPIRDPTVPAAVEADPMVVDGIGALDLSVGDAQLRVYGVKELRSADGSIMPTLTTGNTHAPCVIIGERLAEIPNAELRPSNAVDRI